MLRVRFSTMPHIVRSIVVVALVLGARVAHADDPLARPTDPTARKHLEDGEAFYKVQKWDEAVVEFEKGALLAPDLPVWYFALAQAHRQAGRYERARWYYERFLSSADEDDPDAADAVATVRELIADMDAAQNRPPTEAAPAGVPPRAEPSSPSTLTTSRKVAVGTGVLGVVAIGGGVALGVRAQQLEDDAEAICPIEACARADEANNLLERGQRSALYANIAYGVGTAAIVGAVVLWVTGAPDAAERGMVAVTPRVSGTFAGVNLSLRF